MWRYSGIPLWLALPAFAADDQPYKFVGRCASPVAQVRIRENHAKMDRIFRAIASDPAQHGRKVEIYSCYRSQEHQNSILRRRGCAPFGSRDCRSSVATRSFHTTSTAADMHLAVQGASVCQLLDRVRASQNNNVGGVGGYGGNTGHFDLRNYRGQWNICAKVLGRSTGAYRSQKVQQYREQRYQPARSGDYYSRQWWENR